MLLEFFLNTDKTLMQVKIFEWEDDQKKLRALLHEGSDFEALVKEYCSQDLDSIPIQPQCDTNRIIQKNIAEPVPKTCTQRDQPSATASKQKKQKKSVDNPITQVHSRDLQKAAAELELSELSAFSAVQPSSSVNVPIAINCALSPVENIRTESATNTILRQSFDVLNPQPAIDPVALQIEALNNRVRRLEENSAQADSSLQWLWGAYNQLQNLYSVAQNTSVGSEVQKCPATPVINEPTITSPTEPPINTSPNDNVHGPASTEVTYNGYTKDQLKAKIAGYKEFSKASKVLFRSLYTQSEYTGRSLGGNTHNSKFKARPPLSYPERLDVLYDIIIETYPPITRARIKVRLREILKPSRAI